MGECKAAREADGDCLERWRARSGGDREASLGLRLAIPVSDPRVMVGFPAGVIEFEGEEGGPVPVALVAVTVNV